MTGVAVASLRFPLLERVGDEIPPRHG